MSRTQPGAPRRRLSIPALSAQASRPRRGIQIGPRIRVGGTLGKIGQAAKIGVGKLDKAAAPFVAMIPGVGQIAAPIMNMAGTVMDTSHGGVSLGDLGKAGIQSAGMYGAGKLLNSIPGVSGVTQKLGSAAGSIPGVQGVENFLGGGGGSGGGVGGALGNIASGVGSFLGGNGGKNALGLAEAANAAMLQSRQNDLAKQALGTSQQSYNERAPLRTAGIQGMTNPGAGIQPRIAALTANSSNPFQRSMPPSPAIQGVG